MKKAPLSLLLIIILVANGCWFGGPTQPEVKPPEIPFTFDIPTPDDERKIAMYTENDTFATLAGASPYYLGNQPSDVPGLAQYETLKQKKVDEAIKLTDNLMTACKELKTKLEPYKGSFFDFLVTAQEQEKQLEKYAGESSGQMLEYLVAEETLIANYESIETDDINHLLTKTMLSYQKTMLAIQMGETVIQDVAYLLAATSTLYNAFGTSTDQSIKNQLTILEKDFASIDQINSLVDSVVKNDIYLATALKQIETGDYYMAQAGLEFMETALPDIKTTMGTIAPNDTLNAENIEAINEYEGAMEVFIENMKTNMEGVDATLLLPVESPTTPTSWGIDASLAAYMPSTSQKLTQAYQPMQQTPEQGASTMSKIGSALKTGASFTWEGIKSGFGKAQTVVGVGLDTVGAGTKSIFDAGFGIANGNSLGEVTTEIGGNFKKVGENYDKGTSGSQILKDAGNMLKGVEEGAGAAAEGATEYIVGKGWTSWTVGGLTKMTVGMFTGLGKGIYKVANKQSTAGELVEGMLDIGLSLVGGSKVIIKGSQALKGGKELAKWSASKAFNFLQQMGTKLEQGQLKAMTMEILKNSKLSAKQVLSLISNSLEMEGKEALAAELRAIGSKLNEKFAGLVKDGFKTILGNIKKQPGASYTKLVKTTFENSLKGLRDAMIAKIGKNYIEYIDNLIAKQLNSFIKTTVKEYVDAFYAPKLSDLSGTWSNGQFVITDVIVSDEFREAAKEEGCNLEEIEAQKGKVQPLSMSLSPSGENGGNMSFASGDDNKQSVPFTYADGVIKASVSEKNATGTLSMTVTRSDKNFVSKGSMTISYMEGNIKIIASISATKEVPPPPPEPEEEEEGEE